jgi:hypothetical protein
MNGSREEMGRRGRDVLRQMISPTAIAARRA